MELTEIEQLLLDGLKLYLQNRGDRILVCMMLQEEEQQLTMLEYMYYNEKATREEILEQARRIAGME